ncbi:hypothetical protein [Scytonema sp. UIC 10036]|uniref:hypothetical protein n=1 Tax=Scytonema sp. UIC 10036 TaxID=2304196 RepID=UPI001FAB1C9E|nr:hypothetical protein [Scytonema sp. UIC 10036]
MGRLIRTARAEEDLIEIWLYIAAKRRVRTGVPPRPVPNTARIRIFVGWANPWRNPTNACKCWVSFLNPTYVFSYF